MPESRSRKKAQYTPPPAAGKPKTNPPWLVPTMVTLMVGGLAWVVTTYLTETDFPIPGIGNGNLLVGFILMITGFALTLRWQ